MSKRARVLNDEWEHIEKQDGGNKKVQRTLDQ